MSLVDSVQTGQRRLDKRTGRERIVRAVERLGRVVKILHPGEPVFEAITTLFLGKAGDLATHGGVFYDGAANEAYLFYLGKVPVLKDRIASGTDTDRSSVSETVQEVMVGVRRLGDDRCEEVPAHLLLDLFESDGDDIETEMLSWRDGKWLARLFTELTFTHLLELARIEKVRDETAQAEKEEDECDG